LAVAGSLATTTRSPASFHHSGGALLFAALIFERSKPAFNVS